MAATITQERDQTTNPIDSTKIERGHLMAVVQFVHVSDLTRRDGSKIAVRPIDGGTQDEFFINGKGLVEGICLSADQYKEVIELRATKLVEIFMTCYNKPFTVVFTKQNGEKRTLRGRLVRPEPVFGRSYVEDLDLKTGNRVREVDHRTLEMLIVDGVKYVKVK